MRILQLIDSLRPGGAEQMAVAYANALSRRGQGSLLCCTRKEGLLKKRLEPKVGYFFLEKKHVLDWKAFFQLRKIVKEQQIELLQAHSSSFFLAVLVKMAVPDLKLIWHDHYGKELGERKDPVLQWMSTYFDGVISVNEALRTWAQRHLKAPNVVYFRNFLPNAISGGKTPELAGPARFKIICVANLRPQKDHFNLVRALELVLEEFANTSLHLVGKDEGNSYSRGLRSYILEKKLQEFVFFYGEQEQVEELIRQADIGVLSSSSEGLPIALLEYGRAGVPVVSTRVGEVPKMIGEYGKVVEAEDPISLAAALKFYLRNQDLRKKDARLFQEKVLREFSEDAVIPEILSFYNSILGAGNYSN